MNTLLGTEAFRKSYLFAKTSYSLVKNRTLNPRSFHTSALLFAKKKNTPGTESALAAKVAELQAEVAQLKAQATAKNTSMESKTHPYMRGLNGYKFPIVAGENGLEWYSSQLRKWGTEPPFLNRHDALFTLLCNAYNSVVASMKPVVTLATTSPGFGTTRILVEWIAQAFLHPFIVGSFLADSWKLNYTITTNVEEQIRTALKSTSTETVQRANFLLRLFDAALSPSIITVRAEKNTEIQGIIGASEIVTDVQVLQVCKAILISGIACFNNAQHSLYNLDLPSLANYYLNAVHSASKWPEFVVKDRPKPLLIINIDEVQGFVKRHTRENKNLAFEIARQFLNLSRDSVIINMVGLCTGGLNAFRDQAKFYLVPYLPMDPLLEHKYLKEVCEKVLPKKLYAPDVGGQNGHFSKALSLQLHELWLTTCGIPRSIEMLVEALLRMPLNVIDKLSNEQIAEVRRALVTDRPFTDITKEIGANLTERQWNKLLLDFIFCIPKKPGSCIVGKTCYEDLEASGIIIPFHFNQPQIAKPYVMQDDRNYTIPFYFYTSEIQKALPAFQSNYKSVTNPHKAAWEKHHITLEMVLKVCGRVIIDNIKTAESQRLKKKELGCADTTSDTKKILEETAAVSLWLRYLHKRVGKKANHLVSMDEVLKGFGLTDFYAAWKGVIQLTEIGLCYQTVNNDKVKHPNFDNYVEFLAKNHYIAINTPSSMFADVIAPLYDSNGNFKKIICIQCCNVKNNSNSIQPSYVYGQIEYVLRPENNAIFVILAPNITPTPLSQQPSRLPDHQKTAIENWEKNKELLVSDGKNYLSDWFLRVFSDSFFDVES